MTPWKSWSGAASVVVVSELALEIDPDVAVLQPDRIVQQRLLGLPARLATLQLPLPDVLGAGQHAIGADAGDFERLRHVRAERREGYEGVADPGDQHLNALDLDAGEPAGRNLLRRAKSLPTQLPAPCSSWPRNEGGFRSGSGIPCRAGVYRGRRCAR